MLVSQILKLKADDTVVAIGPDASVSDAVALLATRKIGALIVSRDGKTALGILSERDVVRELGLRGAGVLSETVSALMTAKLVSCQRGDQTGAILQMMTDGRFRHMPVIEGGQLIGMISIGDVVKARVSELSAEKDALEGMIKGF